MTQKCPKKKYHLAGSATVEFALVLPAFLILMFGIIDLARYYFMEQSISHTLRATARYAVTGQLNTNPSYDTSSASSFPYMSRRESIVAAAKQNNPGMLTIDSSSTNDTNSINPNDNFLISASSSVSGTWTNNYCGLGGNYIKLSLTNTFTFLTPLLDLIASSVTGSTFKVGSSLILKSETFSTNDYPATNAQGSSANNYWN